MERTFKKSLKGRLSLMGLCAAMSLASLNVHAMSGGMTYDNPSGAAMPGLGGLQSTLLNGITQGMAQQMMQQMGMGQLSGFMGNMGMQMGMANGLMGSALGANLNLTSMMQGMAAQVVSQVISQGVQQLMSSMTSGGGGGGGSSGSDYNLNYNRDLLSGGTSGGILGVESTTPSFNTAMLTNQNLGNLLSTVVTDAAGGISGGTTTNANSIGDGGLY